MPRKRSSEDAAWFDRGTYDVLTEVRKAQMAETKDEILRRLADPSTRQAWATKKHPGLNKRREGKTFLDYAEWISQTKHWIALRDFKHRYL